MASLAWIQDGTWTRKQLRQMIGSLVRGKVAARPLGGRSCITSPVVLSVTSTVWTVQSHTGILDVETDATMGPSPYAIDGNSTGAVTASSGSFDRWDLLYITMADPTTEPAISYLAGSIGTTLPATPANSVAFAKIVVPQTGHGSPTISQLVPYVDEGVFSALDSTTYPAHREGRYIDDATLGLLRDNGTDYSTGLTMAWQGRQATTFTSTLSGTAVQVNMDTVDVDTASLGFSGGVFTAPIKGLYRVFGKVSFAANATGARQLFYQVNATQVAGSLMQVDASAGSTQIPGPTKIVGPLNPGDTISLWALQNSGSTIALVTGSILGVERI